MGMLIVKVGRTVEKLFLEVFRDETSPLASLECNFENSHCLRFVPFVEQVVNRSNRSVVNRSNKPISIGLLLVKIGLTVDKLFKGFSIMEISRFALLKCLAKTFQIFNEATKLSFYRGHFLIKPLMGISSLNSLLNTFSSIQPTLTNNTPIDSTQLTTTNGNINNF
jgi:hypothetical protein